MADVSLNVLAVVGSLQRDSVTRVVIRQVAEQLQAAGCVVDVLDLEKGYSGNLVAGWRLKDKKLLE